MKKKNKPFISVIMNCHNGEKYLKLSLKSVVGQNYKNWELIFWDNKSNDESKKIALSFKDKRIRYFKSKKFFSLYKARNLAIQKARGKYICFLDTDDWWTKDKLSKQVKLIQSNKNLKFIFSNFFTYNEKLNFKKLHLEYKISHGKITQLLLDDYKIGILTVMIEKKLLKKKKFNTKYNIIGDFDYFVNLSMKEKFYYLDKPLAYYRYHKNNYSKKTKLYINELGFWLKKNSNRFESKGFKLSFLRFFYYKLLIKNFLKVLGV